MTDNTTNQRQVWLITGAGRGLGADLARAALAAGHAVVATGRDPERVTVALGTHEHLLSVKLDITSPEDAHTAVQAAVNRFGRLDVLVNNAGISGQAFCSAYAAAKFGVEGWMESLTPEVAPFGIRTMLVEPGFFRTELLSAGSTTYAEPQIEDDADRTRETVAAWSGMDGQQSGDPAKLAEALIRLAALETPPTRFAAGEDAVGVFKQKAKDLQIQAHAHRELSGNLSVRGA